MTLNDFGSFKDIQCHNPPSHEYSVSYIRRHLAVDGKPSQIPALYLQSLKLLCPTV